MNSTSVWESEEDALHPAKSDEDVTQGTELLSVEILSRLKIGRRFSY